MLVSKLLQAGKVVLTDQQLKEILQEVTRVQTFGELVNCIKDRENKRIQINPESVQVKELIIFQSKIISRPYCPWRSF